MGAHRSGSTSEEGGVTTDGPVELEVRLMGEVVVALSGRTIESFESATTLALLCRLAIEPGRRVRRPVLAELLWPGRPSGGALANLRHALTSLRHSIGDHQRDEPIVRAARTDVSLDADRVWVDLSEFHRLMGAAADAPDPTVVWEQALAHWRGPALSGLESVSSPEWDQWTAGIRAATDRAVGAALDSLTAARLCTGPTAEVEELVSGWLDLDRWNERAHARLIRLMALDGRSAAALGHADAFVGDLRAEFGAGPDAELRAAIESVRSGHADRSGC